MSVMMTEMRQCERENDKPGQRMKERMRKKEKKKDATQCEPHGEWEKQTNRFEPVMIELFM